MTLRRRATVVAGIAFFAMILAACGGGGATTTTTAGQSSAPTAISLFGAQPTTTGNLNTNWFTKYVEKKFDTKYSFDLVPLPDVVTKQPLLLASGNYPDVIWDGSITQPDALKYGSEGIFRPLNSMLKTYVPNVWHLIRTNPTYREAVTAPNGKIYALSNYNDCTHCYWPYEYFINVKMLEQYHLSAPRTTAQFSHVLDVFKQHGVVGITGSTNGWDTDVITFLMNSFIPYDGSTNYFDERNGRLVFAPGTSQWKAGLTYIHSLYSQGAFSKVALTQQETEIEKLVAAQKVGVVPIGDIDGVIESNDASYLDDWFPLPPLKGPHGVASAAYASPVDNPALFAITNKSDKEQEIKMMRLLNFLFTPKGEQLFNFGPKGTYWTPAEKGQQGYVAQQSLYNSDWNESVGTTSAQNEAWDQWGPDDETGTWYDQQYISPAFSPNGSQAKAYLGAEVTMAGHQAPQQYPGAVWVPTAETETYSTDQTNIDSYVTQWTDEFVTGEKSISGDWSSYVSGFKGLDLGQYVQMSKKAAKPLDVEGPALEPDPATIKHLLTASPLPGFMTAYLGQIGVPSSDLGTTTSTTAR